MSDPTGPFKVILSSVDETWNSRLRSEVSRIFQIDDETASNIVSAIPIVVLDGLDARAAGIVRERMRGLVEAGCRVVTTDDPADTIPRVNWPEMPDIARIPPEEPQKVITVQADTSKAPPLASFSCPGCGLLFHVSGASRAQAQANAGTKDKVGAPASPGAGAPSGGVPGTGGTNGKEPHAPASPAVTAPAKAAAHAEPGARLAGDEWLDPPIQTKKGPEPKTFEPKTPEQKIEQKVEKEAPITRAPAPVAKAPEPAPAPVAAAKKTPSLLDDPLLAAKRYDASVATAPGPQEPGVLSTSEPTTLVARPITNRFSRSVVPQGATTAAPPPTARPSAPVPAPSPTTGRFAPPPPPPPPSQSGRFAPPPPAATPSASTPRTAAVPPTKNFGPPPKPLESTHSDAKKADDDELDVRFDADESADMKALQKNAKKPAPVEDDDEPNLLLDSDDKEPEPEPVSKKGAAKKPAAEPPKKGRSFDEDEDDLLPFDELDSQGVDVEAPNAKAASASSSDGSFDGGRIDDLLDAPPQATVSKGKKPDPRFEDDDELLLDDEEPAPKPAKGAPAKKTAVREEEKEETLFGDSGDDKPALKPDKGKAAAGKGSKIPRESGFADALDMFDDDDEQPLGSGAGDDADIPEIKPLDLASDVQGIPAPVAKGGGKKKPESPFDKPSSSAILEPLDPNEAMAILKTHQKEDAELPEEAELPRAGQSRSAGRKPVDPLEPLDPNEALAILGTPDERGKGGKGTPPRKPQRQKNGRTSDASKLVPLSASDEDFAFLEQGKTGGKTAAKSTDPFARAAKKVPSNDKLTIIPKKRDEVEEEEPPARSPSRRDAPAPVAKGGSPGASSKSPKRSAPVPEGQGECGLVLPRIATDSKRQKAAELISEIKGMGVDEALKLTERTIIPVLTGVSRDVAEFHRDKFERNKISARVTTRQKEK